MHGYGDSETSETEKSKQTKNDCFFFNRNFRNSTTFFENVQFFSYVLHTPPLVERVIPDCHSFVAFCCCFFVVLIFAPAYTHEMANFI